MPQQKEERLQKRRERGRARHTNEAAENRDIRPQAMRKQRREHLDNETAGQMDIKLEKSYPYHQLKKEKGSFKV